MAIRVSQHSGRSGSAKHNDRSFLSGWTDRKRMERAPHIRQNASADNQRWCWQANASTFEAAEREFYQMAYAASVDATNKRYIASGHPDRCKTVEDLYTGKLTRPEEMILQIGRQDDVDGKTFTACLNDYLQRLNVWNQDHGNHMHILDIAVHMDETSPHAHIRRVWDYTDKDGLTRLGQNKALEAAGLDLPDPSKAVGRFNNRKMTFDAMARSMWQEVCKSHGLEIATEPLPERKRHKDKAEYIADQMQDEIEALKRAKTALESQLGDLTELYAAKNVRDALEEMVGNLELYRSIEFAERWNGRFRDITGFQITVPIITPEHVQEVFRPAQKGYLKDGELAQMKDDLESLGLSEADARHIVLVYFSFGDTRELLEKAVVEAYYKVQHTRTANIEEPQLRLHRGRDLER